MLKNIDPILTPDVLYALSAMGHSDEVVVVDAHYPAERAARASTFGKLLRIDAGDSGRAVRAILSVFPLDRFVKYPVERMQVDGDPEKIPEVQHEVQQEVDLAEGRSLPFASIERSAFYERAKLVFCVIITGETRGWGCFIFKKGVAVTPNQPATRNNSTIAQWQK